MNVNTSIHLTAQTEITSNISAITGAWVFKLDSSTQTVNLFLGHMPEDTKVIASRMIEVLQGIVGAINFAENG